MLNGDDDEDEEDARCAQCNLLMLVSDDAVINHNLVFCSIKCSKQYDADKRKSIQPEIN